MPRKLTIDTTVEEHDEEIDYTRAALAADPDAADLVATTDGWQPMVDAVRALNRDARRAEAGAAANRRVANGRLDAACTRFGKELRLEAEAGSPRWQMYFRDLPIAGFVRQAFEGQVRACERWLSTSGDPLFERHRPALAPIVSAARTALTMTDAVALAIGRARLARGTLAEDMTRERDGLWNVLDARGRERGKERAWADLFFRQESARPAREPEPAPPEPSAS